MAAGQRWSDLPKSRRLLVIGVIALGIAVGVFISTSDNGAFREAAKSGIATLSYGLAAFICSLRAVIAFKRRESWWMKGGMLILAVMFAALRYTYWGIVCCAPDRL